jgi:hypothetical protein
MYCGGGDDDASATVAHTVKRVNGEVKEDIGTASESPHAVAPVGAPSAYCCVGERRMSCYGGAEDS